MKTLLKTLLLFCCAVQALAVPGPARAGDVSRHALGGWVVYCFSEGDRDSREEIITLTDRAKALKATPGWNRTGMNFFVLDTGASKVLIDAGNTGANTRALLAQAGIVPEAVTDVLLTHMHRDHIGGLLDANGGAVFPKATLHVAREEAAYWRGRAEAADRVLTAYANRLDLFEQNRQIGPVASIPAFGHTPGHTVFRVQSNGQRLLFWGDITHVRAQFADPGVYLSYDVDARAALATRRKLLAQLAESGEAVAGAHIPSPGIGRIAKEDKAGEDYRFTPLPPQQ